MAYSDAGRMADAIALHESVFKIREAKARGPDHPETLTSRQNLATVYHSAGRTTQAITYLYERTLKAE